MLTRLTHWKGADDAPDCLLRLATLQVAQLFLEPLVFLHKNLPHLTFLGRLQLFHWRLVRGDSERLFVLLW